MGGDDNLDPRTRVVGRLAVAMPPSSGGAPGHPAGTPIVQTTMGVNPDGQIYSFTSPSLPALSLGIVMRAVEEAEAIEPAVVSKPVLSPFGTALGLSDDSMPGWYDYFERCMVVAVFCFHALEAFCNEVIDHRAPSDFEFTKADGTRVRGSHRLQDQISLADKLSTVLPAVLNAPSPRETPLWDGFETLKKARHATVHVKAKDSNPRIATQEDLANQTLLEQFIWTEPRSWAAATIAMIRHFEPHYIELSWLNTAKRWIDEQ